MIPRFLSFGVLLAVGVFSQDATTVGPIIVHTETSVVVNTEISVIVNTDVNVIVNTEVNTVLPTEIPSVASTVWSTLFPGEGLTTLPTVASTVEPTEAPGDPRCTPGCTFEPTILDSATLKYFPKNCSTVCTASALYIGYETDLTEKQMIDTFKNMKHLVGDLIVTRSKYKTARFLASLESVDCYNYGFFKFTLNDKMTEIGLPNLANVSCRIHISSNNNLTRLNMPHVIPIQSTYANYSTIDVEISYSAPSFCITIEEMSNLMTYEYIKFSLITGSYCAVSSNSTSSEKKTCDLQNYTWSNMSTECVNVYGDVIIDFENQDLAYMFESVESIFGSLMIYGTNLTSIDFLGKLEHIISLTEEQPALIVEMNSILSNVSFPSLQRIQSRAYVPVLFNNNSVSLLKDPSYCYDIRNSVTTSDTWIVKFDDQVCEDVEKAAAASVVKDKSTKGAHLHPFLITIVSIGVLFYF